MLCSVKSRLIAFLLAAGMCCLTTTVRAVVVWDEGIHGDLSGDGANPDVAALVFGSNTLTATSVSGDREYISFSMPAAGRLSAVVLDAYSGIDATAFIAVQSGTTFTEPPSGTNPANLLGYSHFGPGVEPVGSDILPSIGMGGGSMGFTPPLPAGNYTFWIQQTGDNASTYTFDFVVTPEPGALVLLGMGSAIVLAAWRRRAPPVRVGEPPGLSRRG